MSSQPPSPLESETLEPAKRLVVALPARIPTLTIARHPDLRRVGQRAMLSGLAVDGHAVLSRAEPGFLDRGGRSHGALSDPHISRAPIRFASHGHGVMVDLSATRGAVEIDGRPASKTHLLTARELEDGALLAIAGSVLLVLRLAVTRADDSPHHGLIGTSDATANVRHAIDVAARHDDAVLLLGESGAGKELVASAIHRASPRASGPFVAINMAALTPSTAAAELFGHARGAFTGAEGTHGGHFGRADGGTLFLDEVGDTPAAIQPMLLRALETGEIDPVGGRGSRPVNVRVIAATDRDLDRAVDEGRFRLPLVHRLAAERIALPSLRERREDVLPLFVHFLREELPDVRAEVLPLELATELANRAWPGNVRELRNAARSLAREGVVRLGPPDRQAPRVEPSPTHEHAAPLTDARLAETLRRNGFRIGATARELGIARNTLYKHMEQCAGLRRARDLDAREIEACRAACDGDLDATAARLEVSPRALLLRARELGLPV